MQHVPRIKLGITVIQNNPLYSKAHVPVTLF